MVTGEFNAGGVQILLVTPCCRNQDKLCPDGPLGSYADFTFFTLTLQWTSIPSRGE